MATFKLLLGLGMTLVLPGIAGSRLGFPYRVGASAQPVEPGCVGRTILTDGVAQRRIEGAADDSVEVLDIAEVLLRSVRPDLDDASSSGATTAPTSEQ
jgi:hypothetical protein